MIHFEDDSIRLGFDPESGALRQFAFRSGENVLGHGGATAGLDVRLGPAQWLGETTSATLLNHAHNDDAIELVISFGPLIIRDKYTRAHNVIERTVQLENNSKEELQVTAVRLMLSGVQIGEEIDCRFEAPATAVRPRLPLNIAGRQKLGGPFAAEFAPGAPEMFERAMEDAPDVTPGILAVHNPKLQESLLVWYFSEIEAATPLVWAQGDALAFGHELALAGWLPPGESLHGGTQYILLHNGSWEDALGAFQSCYSNLGLEPPIYGTPPPWVPQSAIYEVHPGPFGGFRDLADDLPRIQAMGFNTLYLMPVMSFDNHSGLPWDENWRGSGSPYAMRDFELFEPTLGTEGDFKDLVERAHALGVKVLMDFVPQGCALDARYVDEHPEWFCRDEEGNLVSSHGWTDTYSLDWANTDYQEYMLGWALRFIKDYDIDGYRIDAPHGKEPNWDRKIPYHASYTNLGVLRMLEQLQRGMKAIKPEATMLCELFGPVFVKSHDFQYDYYPLAMLSALLRRQLTTYELGEWLKDYWSVMPPSAVRVAFMETHDTRDGFQSYAWRGSAAERGLFALLIMAGFVPMIWAGQERGNEKFYHDVLQARASSIALLEGKREYNSVGCEQPEVVSILSKHDDEVVWGVISLYGERTPLKFELPEALQLDPTITYRLVDLITDSTWDEYGKTEWVDGEIKSPTLSLIPYVPYFFRVASERS